MVVIPGLTRNPLSESENPGGGESRHGHGKRYA